MYTFVLVIKKQMIKKKITINYNAINVLFLVLMLGD